jgi:hypothetical protein
MVTQPSKIVRELRRIGGAAQSAIVRTIRARGYYVAPDFLPSDVCAEFVAYIDELLARRPEKVQHEEAEGTSGDYRLFGAESESATLKQMVADNAWLRTIARRYLGEDVATHFVLANKVVHAPGRAVNSGAGWHRDSGRRQFKAIVYLTDVGHDNGPFTIIPNSRDLQVPAREAARNSHRFDDHTIHDLVKNSDAEILEMVGSAGTCILADTSHIHRGKDIERGVRYALTNYYFEDSDRRRQKTQAKWGQYLLKPVA